MLTASRSGLLRLRVRHRLARLRPPTDYLSPVIVAENMIGVAMYELVCGSYAFQEVLANGTRSVSVTTTS